MRFSDRFLAAAMVAVFFSLVVTMVFHHNSDLSMTTAVFIDSGSLLHDYLAMAEPTATLNQNLQYHAGIYGWAYNSVITWGIVAMKHVVAIGGHVLSYTDFAVWARLISLLATCAGLYVFFLMLRAYSASKLTAVVLTLLAATFPPLVKFSYEIHPEPFGFLFANISLLALRKFATQPGYPYRWLLLGWVGGIICVMSKQSFLVYPLIPVAVAAFHIFRTIEDKRAAISSLVKTGFIFGAFLLLSIALFHPYALLSPSEFFDKQADIRSFHSTMFRPVGVVAASWFRLLLENDYWILLATLLALARICTNRLRGSLAEVVVDCICCALLLLCLVFVQELRFYIFRAYVYPLIPLAAIAVVATIERFPTRYGRAILLFLISAIPLYAIASAGLMAQDLRATGSMNVEVHRRLTEFGSQRWSVLYSPSLAVPTALYTKTANAFQLDPAMPDIAQLLQDWDPDVALIDTSFLPESAERLSALLEKQGLVRAGTITGFPLYPMRCNMNNPLDLRRCVGQILQKSGWQDDGAAAVDYAEIALFARPELAPQVGALGDL